jgi:hypothetical protein
MFSKLSKLVFHTKWNEFVRECKKNGIIAKSNLSCCPSCGHHVMEENYDNGRYRAYVFFHVQEGDRIRNVIKRGENSVVVHLNWASFDEDIDDNDLMIEIQSIAKRVGCRLKYKDIDTTLFLFIKLDVRVKNRPCIRTIFDAYKILNNHLPPDLSEIVLEYSS